MKKLSNAISFVYIAIAIFFFVISLKFPEGSNGAVGPGYFPRIMCVLVAFLSILNLILSRKEVETPEQAELKIFKKENLRVWITMGITLVYIICIKVIGFVVSSIVFQIGINYYFKVHEKSKLAFCVLPFAVVAALYYVFHNLLHVILPAGILF